MSDRGTYPYKDEKAPDGTVRWRLKAKYLAPSNNPSTNDRPILKGSSK